LRQPVLLPRSSSRGSAPYIGIRRLSATSRSSGVVLYGIRWLRAAFGISDRYQREPGAGMAGNYAGEQPEVILDDRFGDRLRRHVDHAQPWLAKQQEQEQGAFLHRLHDGAAAGRGAFDADRGDDHDGFVLQVEP